MHYLAFLVPHTAQLKLEKEKQKLKIISCLGFYALSTVFQLFNSDRSQIHVSWTIFNQLLTSQLS